MGGSRSWLQAWRCTSPSSLPVYSLPLAPTAMSPSPWWTAFRITVHPNKPSFLQASCHIFEHSNEKHSWCTPSRSCKSLITWQAPWLNMNWRSPTRLRGKVEWLGRGFFPTGFWGWSLLALSGMHWSKKYRGELQVVSIQTFMASYTQLPEDLTLNQCMKLPRIWAHNPPMKTQP